MLFQLGSSRLILSSVTFICSKTDDISLMEASDSLGLDEQNGPLWKELDQCAAKQESLQRDLRGLTDTKATYGEIMSDCDDQQEIWEELMAQVGDGNTVFAPSENKKRKMSGNLKQRKKQKRSSEDEDEDFINDDDSDKEEAEDAEDDDPSASQTDPLTEELVTAKLGEIKATKKEARRSRLDIDDHIKGVRREIAAIKEAALKIEADISSVCIAGRNEYSKGAIQQDFAGRGNRDTN